MSRPKHEVAEIGLPEMQQYTLKTRTMVLKAETIPGINSDAMTIEASLRDLVQLGLHYWALRTV